MARHLHSFQQLREPPPPEAEKFPANLFQRKVSKPSKWVEGVDVETTIQTCPGCAADILLEHGDRIQCGCGMRLELYGNGLTVWR